jgi:hypothetical protein
MEPRRRGRPPRRSRPRPAGWSCGASTAGCRTSKHLELHHLDLRSEGGKHDPARIVALCWTHHRSFHRGTLVIDGRAPGALAFSHPDGTRYGAGPDPAEVERRADALSALRQLGVREGDARRALAAVGSEATGSLESLLRAALRVLARTTYAGMYAGSRASEPGPTWVRWSSTTASTAARSRRPWSSP